jgi:hypothetical protein
MSPSLRSYLDKHCTRHPAAVMPILDLTRDFRASLATAERREWTRQRVISELLAHGFTCGIRDRVFHVAGLAPVGTWHTVNGKLELAHA